MENKKNLESIYSLYVSDLFRYLLSLTQRRDVAEDLVHEAFYRVMIHLDSYKGEDIRPWLFKIAYHTFVDWHRKEKRYTSVPLEDYHLPSSPSAEDEALRRNELHHWLHLLSSLPLTRRNIVLLRDYYAISYQEIANMTGFTLAKVKMELYRGRQDLKKIREAQG